MPPCSSKWPRRRSRLIIRWNHVSSLGRAPSNGASTSAHYAGGQPRPVSSIQPKLPGPGCICASIARERNGEPIDAMSIGSPGNRRYAKICGIARTAVSLSIVAYARAYARKMTARPLIN